MKKITRKRDIHTAVYFTNTIESIIDIDELIEDQFYIEDKDLDFTAFMPKINTIATIRIFDKYTDKEVFTLNKGEWLIKTAENEYYTYEDKIFNKIYKIIY